MKIHSILTHFCWKEKLPRFLLSKSQLSKQKGAGRSQFKPSEASTFPLRPGQVAGWLEDQHRWLMCLHQMRWGRAERMHTDPSCEPMTGLQTGHTHTHRLWTPVDIHDTFWTDAFESPIGQVWHEAASLNNNKFLTRILGGEAFCAPINAIGLGVACCSPWGRKEWLNWTELNCGAGENSWESLGQQGDQTSKY